MRYLAVDLGATSVRVCAVDIDDADATAPQVIHRAPHRPVRASAGGLRWDWPAILADVEIGLRAGIDHAKTEGIDVAGIGIDTWGVDYGLLDGAGQLLSSPWSYRSERTQGWREVAERMGVDRLYATTGIQLMEINTVFQLAAHDPAELERAEHLLMLPELVVHHLTGAVLGEITSAGTTGLIDARTRTWAPDLLAAIDVNPALFPALSPAGTVSGEWQGVPVRLVAGHDTASAVAGLPAPTRERSAFLCSGSWLLVGAQLDEPDLSAQAQRANFSNEPDLSGGVRLLKNVPGFVVLEQLREQWAVASVAELVAGDSLDTAQRARVDAEIESLARRAADVLDELGALIGGPVEEVRLVGGGVHIGAFVDRLRTISGIDVIVGSGEATSLGNARVQHQCQNPRV